MNGEHSNAPVPVTTETLVTRLRELPQKLRTTPVHLGVHIKLLQDAADEIERLQAMYLSAVRGRAEFRKLVQEMRSRIEEIP